MTVFDSLRWITASHRGLYVHTLAFPLTGAMADTAPGPRWGYLMGVGQGKTPTADMQYSTDRLTPEDYFTREAAEQAGLDMGKRIADVILENV